MALTIYQPESLAGGGNFVDKPGTYHFVITVVDENPAKDDGTPIPALKVSCSVLSGTDPNQKDRTFDMMLWHPRAEDSSDMPKKKQTRFCIAAGLLAEHKPGQRATVEPTDAVGRQIVVKLSPRQKKDDTTGKWVDTDRVDVHYSDIWHVDDQEVRKAGVPLDQEALKLIPAQLRKPVTNGNGGRGQAGGHSQPGNGAVTAPVAVVGSTRGGVDLSGV